MWYVIVATETVTVPTECGAGIIIIIDSSYRAHIFLLNKISMRSGTPFTYSYIPVDMHIICCHRNGLPRLRKRLSKEEIL